MQENCNSLSFQAVLLLSVDYDQQQLAGIYMYMSIHKNSMPHLIQQFVTTQINLSKFPAVTANKTLKGKRLAYLVIQGNTYKSSVRMHHQQ